jgi:hypothetical protein
MRRVEIVYVKPIFDHVPYPNREAALEEKMSDRLVMSPTERTNSPIRPTHLCKPIRRPNAILDDEPGEKLAFGKSPSLPNNGIHAGSNSPRKLSLISGRARIGTIVGELPNDGVGGTIV